jgi:dTDP-4-dehydrorhamnose reductase
VVGASGLLGGHLMHLAPESTGTYRRVPRPGLRPLDLAEEASVETLLRTLAPLDTVVIAINPPGLDWCEVNPGPSRSAAADLGRFLAHLRGTSPSATVIFLSSEYLFDGMDAPYDETAVPRPLQEYGRHKLAGEAAVSASGLAHWIVRTSVLYGEDVWQPVAVTSYPLHVVAAARTGAEIVATDNLWTKPTEVRSLARAVWALAARPAGGVVHAAGGPRTTRWDLAEAALRAWGLRPWPGLRRVSADVEGRVPGQTLRRPRDSSLRTDRIESLLGEPLSPLDEGLAAVRGRWKGP